MRIFIADTETTGISTNDRVVEYGHIEVELRDGQLVEIAAERSLLNPGFPIPAGASNVHGIFDEHVADAPTIEEWLPSRLPKERFLALGHNFQFDMKFLGRFMPEDVQIGCTLKLASKLVDAPNHKLETLKTFLKLSEQDSHSALGDVRTCMDLINWVMREKNVEFEEVVAIMTSLPTVWPIRGKYHNVAITDLPLDYVRWALENLQNLDSSLRQVLRNRL